MKCGQLFGLLLGLAGPAAAGGAAEPGDPGKPVNERTVTRAIDKAVEYLYATAGQEGVWDELPPPKITLSGQAEIVRSNWGGKTALTLYALAAAGQEGAPRFRKALEWLMKQKLWGTYALGLRLSLIHQLRDAQRYRQVMTQDADLLLRSRRRTRWGAGWQYLPPPSTSFYSPLGIPCDYSNVNYAVLGLWAACDERYPVPQSVWPELERIWTGGQMADGGWSYYPAHFVRKSKGTYHQSYGSMTTAGIASLYLIIDLHHARRGGLGAFRKTPSYESIDLALKWMARNFSPSTVPATKSWEWSSYYYYNAERVAAAAGLKHFGRHDWFREIAAVILDRQDDSGAITIGLPQRYGGIPVDTAYCLLFLCKGSAPVVFNKLQHAGDWDNHIRELAALTDWLARQSERPANWQVVDLSVPAEDLTDSRILYVAGLKPLKFSAVEKARLKRFVELGGLLVFHPDGLSAGFERSVGELLGELWPKLKLSPVDVATHPIGQVYLPLPESVRLEQLASPTRVLAFVVHDQPAEAWERRQHQQKKHLFDLGAALHYFANDRAPLKEMPTKLTYFAEDFRRQADVPVRAFTLARIRYGDDPHRWDPEPLAFERFARRLATESRINCRLSVVAPHGLGRSRAKVAHLTGVDSVKEIAAGWRAIDKWLRAGGTLIVDQAGGHPGGRGGAFDTAFRKLMEDRYGPGALRPLAPPSPFLSGLEKLPHRNVTGQRRASLRPRLECVWIADRPAIIYSPCDVTCGLLGNPNPMVSGVHGDGAWRLFSRLVLVAAGMEPEKESQP